ncbi:DNA methylase N-4/N-6 domain protein [Desulforamulus reducens MI-1]|uniref:DNA methylase N-4/N-6 domain protein n=1 Tax=Desulforamulus reducens (strain ATCC BAA-1160 / DSM 100696 / MI-1) TaxID=349161 RepID=A4J1V6_DESRM|nr:site-specific DNA-methyltransferase [Desulforamulus reducens]ABO49059.1 DNA methylase N-4/N-6 domain protein [Desulforamulus reducens MI-1]
MTDSVKMDLRSQDLLGERIQQLKKLFPEVFAEGKIDFTRLKQALGENLDTERERYGLSWAGKSEAIKNIQTQSHGTLLPVPEESVNFDTTENLIIEGDNLEVLKLLQKSYHGKVKMIYIDPPYNTGNEFIYPDNFKEGLEDYLRYSGQVDGDGIKLSTNTETEGRFHSKWLNMMYPRLFLARNLLREDGVIFVSIDDNEVKNLRSIMDEIFGEENFVSQFIWNTEGHTDNQFQVKVNHEYIVLYAKNQLIVSLGYIIDPNTRGQSNLWKGYAENSITKNGEANPPSEVLLPSGFPCVAEKIDLDATDVSSEFYKEVSELGYISRQITQKYNISYPIRKKRMIVEEGKLVEDCLVFSGWANVNKLKEFIKNDFKPLDDEDGNLLEFYLSERGVIYYKKSREKARNILSVLRNMGTTEQMRSELERLGILFQYPKPKELLQYLIKIGSAEGEIVLDFFAGSGTTAHAVLDLNAQDNGNRKFILVQLPEPTNKPDYPTIADITKERVLRVISKLNEEDQNKLDFDGKKQDRGFRVFKLTSSNFKIWDGNEASIDPAQLEQQLNMFTDNLVSGRTQLDILYEILLKAGYPLTSKVNKVTAGAQEFYSVDEGLLLICLEKEIQKETLQAMMELEPVQVVCLDVAFQGNDQLKTNTVLEMKSHKIIFHTV